jgi:hypothetical protein
MAYTIDAARSRLRGRFQPSPANKGSNQNNMKKCILNVAALVAAMLVLFGCGGGGGDTNGTPAAAATPSTQVLPVEPLREATPAQPAGYAPYTANGFYAPQLHETIDLNFTDYKSPVKSGAPAPSDFVAMIEFSEVIVYYHKDGSEAWVRPSLGRYVTASSEGILANATDAHQVDLLDFDGNVKRSMVFENFVNYARIDNDRLIVSLRRRCACGRLRVE